MSLAELERLGPFELVRSLTRPGRAEVYLGRLSQEARDSEALAGREMPETAIIKVLRPPDQVDPANAPRVQEAMARFVEEGRLSTRLRHPAITKTYGVALDRTQNLHFIIQEYIEGITLAQLLDHCASREIRLQYSVALRLIIPILKALHYAYHDALREDGRPLRVVHRDIKPANIMLTYDGRAILLDLASARSTSFTRQQTVQDVVMGTAHYLAPEQVYDLESVSHQTDIFATAVVLYELCSLTPLLPRTRRLSEIAQALARFNFADHAPNIDPVLYPGLADVLAQALSPDPTTRYQTAGEFARDLDGLLLLAGDGPGLGAFAADLRRQWEGDGQTERSEERARVIGAELTPRSRSAVDLSRAGEPSSLNTPAPAPAITADQPLPRPTITLPTSAIEPFKPQAPPPPPRSYVELAVAALVGFPIAAATLYMLQSW